MIKLQSPKIHRKIVLSLFLTFPIPNYCLVQEVYFIFLLELLEPPVPRGVFHSVFSIPLTSFFYYARKLFFHRVEKIFSSRGRKFNADSAKKGVICVVVKGAAKLPRCGCQSAWVGQKCPNRRRHIFGCCRTDKARDCIGMKND